MVRSSIRLVVIGIHGIGLVHLVAVVLLLLVGVIRRRHGVPRVTLLRVLIDVGRRWLYPHIRAGMQSDRVGLAAILLIATGIARLALPAGTVLGIVRMVRVTVGPSLLLREELLLSLSRSTSADLNVVGTVERTLGAVSTGRSDSITPEGKRSLVSLRLRSPSCSTRHSLELPASAKVTSQSCLFRLITSLAGGDRNIAAVLLGLGFRVGLFPRRQRWRRFARLVAGVLDMRPRCHPVLDGRRNFTVKFTIMAVPLARCAGLRCLGMRPLRVPRVGTV